MAETKEKTKKTRRGIRLKTIADVRRLLAKTTNRLLKKEIDVNEARALAYLASVLLQVLERDKDKGEQKETTKVYFVGVDPEKM